jgi:flagellar biosynthesis protein FlhF
MTEFHADDLRTFTGRSAREVYAKVRAELGHDAVIVEQHSERGVVTVVASRDFPEPPAAKVSGHDIYCQRLRDLGFEDSFLARLPARAESWQALQQLVVNAIALETPPQRLQGAYRFVGAPGVGKTTSIIKLTAEHVLNFGAGSCALVSTDQRRLAGCEQLAIAAELLGVKFIETTTAELDASLKELTPQRELILVDTAGASAGQPGYEPAACPDVIVVPATWQASALRRTWQQLPATRAAGVILTQIDQCESPAAALSELAQWGVPLRWLSSGPDLYDDLEPVNRKKLLQMLFGEIDRSQNSTTFA